MNRAQWLSDNNLPESLSDAEAKANGIEIPECEELPPEALDAALVAAHASAEAVAS